ncbi:chromate transporter [Mycoplasma sp. 128]
MKQNNKRKEKAPRKATFWNVFLFSLMCTFIGFGGGNAILPVINKIAVKQNKWITESEFDDAVITSNMIPGASVIQTLSFVSIKAIGFWKGSLALILAALPHLLFALVVFILLRKYANNYLYAIAAGVMPIIIGVILTFGWRYLKAQRGPFSLWLWISLFVISFAYCLFIPSPYNIPAIPMIAIILVFAFYALWQTIKQHKMNKKDSNKDTK